MLQSVKNSAAMREKQRQRYTGPHVRNIPEEEMVPHYPCGKIPLQRSVGYNHEEAKWMGLSKSTFLDRLIISATNDSENIKLEPAHVKTKVWDIFDLLTINSFPFSSVTKLTKCNSVELLVISKVSFTENGQLALEYLTVDSHPSSTNFFNFSFRY